MKNLKAKVSVVGSGAGIPSDKLEEVFERFYQIESDDNIQGTGIGLAFSKRMVEMHYGSINVNSQVGVGTTFTFKIPINKEAFSDQELTKQAFTKIDQTKDSNESHPQSLSTDAENRNETLLIVEDNKEVRSF